MKQKLLLWLLLLVALLLLTGSAVAAPAADERITWTNLVSGSGGESASPAFEMNLTVGQTASGPASSPLYRVELGYWTVTRPNVMMLPAVFNTP